MSAVLTRARRFVLAAGRRPDEQRATCPTDHLMFTPRYTDGACPLCGWRPEGMDIQPPLSVRMDWFWPSMGFLLACSVAMAILVIVLYNR
jgi:hypothetical protein